MAVKIRLTMTYLYRWIHLPRSRPHSCMYSYLQCCCTQLDHCILRCFQHTHLYLHQQTE